MTPTTLSPQFHFSQEVKSFAIRVDHKPELVSDMAITYDFLAIHSDDAVAYDNREYSMMTNIMMGAYSEILADAKWQGISRRTPAQDSTPGHQLQNLGTMDMELVRKMRRTRRQRN